jgi:uncharacterized membrane protein
MSNSDTQVNKTIDLKTIVNLTYGLFALGVVTAGFFSIAAVAAMVLIYVKRADASGTFYAMHFDWLTQTFWWGLLWLALSGIATYIYVGWLGIAATAIWMAYRLITGWLALIEGRAPSAI